MYRKVGNDIESYCIVTIQLQFFLHILYCYGTFFFTVNELLIHYYYIIINWSPYLFQILLFFVQHTFSVQGSHPECQIVFSPHVSIGSSRLWWFLRLLVLITLTAVRNAGQLFYRLTLNWGLLDVLVKIRLVLWDLGTEKLPFSSDHTNVIYGEHDFSCWCWPQSSGWECQFFPL